MNRFIVNIWTTSHAYPSNLAISMASLNLIVFGTYGERDELWAVSVDWLASTEDDVSNNLSFSNEEN